MSTSLTVSASLIDFDQKQIELTPGTFLVRENGLAFPAGDGDGRRIYLERTNL